MNSPTSHILIDEKEKAFVEKHLGDKVICTQCQATLASYQTRCSVPLNEPCEGFLAIEGSRKYYQTYCTG